MNVDTTGVSSKPRDSKPQGIRPSDEEFRAQFPALFYSALRRRNASKVRSLAKRAGEGGWHEAARPLCDFLQPPSPKSKTPRRSRGGWPEARAAAVRALRQIGHPLAPQVLVHVLACDPDFVVRAAANAAVQRLGSSAVPVIVETIRRQIDWDLDGMRALLTGLGDHGDLSDADRRAAGMVLMDVLYENFPETPRRWSRHAPRVGRLGAIVATAAMILGLQSYGCDLITAVLVSLIPGQIAGLVARIAVKGTCEAAYSGTERGQLHAIATQSILRLNDKRAIPGMLQLAFDTLHRTAGRHARVVLLKLLPQVTERDNTLFSTIDMDNINVALSQQVDPELMLALLNTLQAVGTGASISRVKRLAKKSRFEEVRAIAAQTLEVLEARDARARLAQILLRGAPAPRGPAGEMLRAAALSASDQPEQLLRPTKGDSSS